MKGMHFVILNTDGTNTTIGGVGVIQGAITQERYLCTFNAKPAVSRLVNVEEITGWNLFDNADHAQQFINNVEAGEEAPGANAPPASPEIDIDPEPTGETH